MRICIAYSSGKNKKIENYARSLGKGLEKQCNSIIDLIDIDKDSDKRLTAYSYILFGCDKISTFNSNVKKSFLQFLKNCGHITGKHTFAFTSKGFGSAKFISKLMKSLENEGVFLKNSSVISSDEEAVIIGSKLHIK